MHYMHYDDVPIFVVTAFRDIGGVIVENLSVGVRIFLNWLWRDRTSAKAQSLQIV